MVGGFARARAGLIFGAPALAAPAAHAGAWAIPEGAQQWFATVSRESGDFGQAWRADDFNEMGLGDGWGLTAKFESEIRAGTTYDDRSGFRLGVMKAFPLGDRASFAIHASFLGGESLDGLTCAGDGYEARAAVGTSFVLADREGYVNVEVGRRIRGDCERDVAEFATGLRFAPGWNLQLKTWQDGAGASGSAKAEIAVSRDFWGIEVGVGWREEISGNFGEKGWIISAATRF